MGKCLYCNIEIPENSVIDFCEKCGLNVFGEKMLKAIIENMKNARDKGDLYQGNVGENFFKDDEDNIEKNGEENLKF